MPPEDRDRSFEKALAAHLRLNNQGSGEAECPDAETLAAFQEKSLSPEEMRYWEQHTATCARCRESLWFLQATEMEVVFDDDTEVVPAQANSTGVSEPAAPGMMELPRAAAPRPASAAAAPRITDAASPISFPAPRPKRWRWAIPAGAIAAGLLLFVTYREQQMTGRGAASSQNAELAQREMSRSDSLPSPPANATPSASPGPVEAKKAKDSGSGNQVNATPHNVAPPPPVSTGAVALDAAQMTPNQAAANENLAARIRKNPSTSAGAAPSVAAGALKPAQTQAPADRLAEQLNPSAPSPALRDSDAKSQNVQVDKTIAKRINIAAIVQSPDHSSTWTLGRDGTILHTTAGSKNGTTQQTGVDVALIAGSATSAKVCWVIGRNGTILRTEDGGTLWMKLESPIPGDIGGIHATDAQHATIWDSANHLSFETSDGGLTWTQVANE